MKNQDNHELRAAIRTTLLAVFLAALLPAFLAAAPPAKLDIKSNAVIEITGGEGRKAWRLAYGTLPQRGPEDLWQHMALLVPAGPNRAWFGHGRWLRLIDTEKGIVVGRWPFPAPITEMRVEGDKLRVQVQEGASGPRSYRREVVFDPAKPDIPSWPAEWLAILRVPLRETYYEWPAQAVAAKWSSERSKPEEAKSAVPASEETVRRDPLSPWLAVKLWRLRSDAGDPRANEALEQALQAGGTDYTELLSISAFFEGWGASQEADRFFDAGYRDFLGRGGDPRLLSIFIERLFLYTARWDRLSPQRRDVYLTNLYHFAPGLEGGELAWRAYSDLLERNPLAGTSPTARAQIWRERAEYARQNSLYPTTPAIMRLADHLLLISAGAALAGVFFVFVLYLRYRPQRVLDAITYKRLLGPVRRRWNLFDWLGLAAVAGIFSGVSIWLHLPKEAPGLGERAFFVLTFVALPLSVAYALVLRARETKKAAKERGLPKPARALFCIEYWSRRERVIFLLIVLVGWLAAGLIHLPAHKYLLADERDVYTLSMGAGHLGSPLTVQCLERKPPAPGRDLFLALAYQHAREPDKAEALYRRIPQFAESWNNLGVLLQRRGRTEEAKQAFEHALRIDPQLQEARLNAGQGAHGEWAELHRKYLPGVPMLAPPRRAHLGDILPPLTWKSYLAVSAGPLSQDLFGLILGYSSSDIQGWQVLPVFLTYALLPLVALAITALLLIPAREVSQPQGPLQPLWEALFPGTATRWAYGSVALLLFWGYSVMNWMLMAGLGTPYLASAALHPNVSRAFGLVEVSLRDLLQPGWPLAFGIPALVFVANLVVVLVRRPGGESAAVSV